MHFILGQTILGTASLAGDELNGLLPGFLLQAIVLRGRQTGEGVFIQSVAAPWFGIINLLRRDPKVAFEIPPERWEEIVAGAYQKAGYEDVVLTPRSGDYGRDVIATKRVFGTVRIINQVKAYSPSHLVTANDVRALAGVLHCDGASKGVLTTTSDFAPKLRDDPLIAPLMPARLELMDGRTLLTQLHELSKTNSNLLQS